MHYKAWKSSCQSTTTAKLFVVCVTRGKIFVCVHFIDASSHCIHTPPVKDQSNVTTFTMIVKAAQVKNAMSAVTILLYLILAKYLCHTLS